MCLAVSHLYGFGLMDAEAMVKEAERWKQVPAQHICVESADRQIRYYTTNASLAFLSLPNQPTCSKLLTNTLQHYIKQQPRVVFIRAKSCFTPFWRIFSHFVPTDSLPGCVFLSRGFHAPTCMGLCKLLHTASQPSISSGGSNVRAHTQKTCTHIHPR